MAKRKSWSAGKTITPEFAAISRKHAADCPTCGMPPYTSERDHNIWRQVAEEHIGEPLPPTFVTPGGPKVISKQQFQNVEDRAKNGWMPDDEEDRGIVCPKGCGTRIRGSLKDIQEHNDKYHPGE